MDDESPVHFPKSRRRPAHAPGNYLKIPLASLRAMR